MKLKSFKKFLEGVSVINTHLFYSKNVNVKFSTKADGSHSLESRLERANVNIETFKTDIKKVISRIKSEDKNNYGIYFCDFGDYKIIGRYSNKQFLVITILNKNMKAKDYDKKYIIEFFTGNDLSNNTFTTIKDKEIFAEYFVEINSDETLFYGENVYELDFAHTKE